MVLIPILFIALSSYLIVSDPGSEVKAKNTQEIYHVGTADRVK